VGRTNIGGRYFTLQIIYQAIIKQKRQVSLLFSRYFDPWEEWQEGIIDQDSTVTEKRTLVIGQIDWTMDTIIMAGQSKAPISFC
jgi:hypothetical protein